MSVRCRFAIRCLSLLTICASISACLTVEVKQTIATDCVWYSEPGTLSRANADHLAAAPDSENMRQFVGPVLANRKKYARFCKVESGLRVPE